MDISHKEPLSHVNSDSVSEVPQKLVTVNPWNFPWAQPVSTRFEFYRIDEMTISYVASCPITTTGVVRIRYEPDVADAPLSGQGMLASGYNFITPAYKTASITIDPSKFQQMPWKYTTSQNDVTGRLNDYGSIHIWCSDISASVGQIWISYHMKFKIPQMEKNIPVTSFVSGGSEHMVDDSVWYGPVEGLKLNDKMGNLVAETKKVVDSDISTSDLASIVFNRAFTGELKALKNTVDSEDQDIMFYGNKVSGSSCIPPQNEGSCNNEHCSLRSVPIQAKAGDVIQALARAPVGETINQRTMKLGLNTIANWAGFGVGDW